MEEKVISIISLVTNISKEELLKKSACEGVWNSLHHVEIIISLEEEFEISFTPDEIAEARTVDVMMETVKRKVNG